MIGTRGWVNMYCYPTPAYPDIVTEFFANTVENKDTYVTRVRGKEAHWDEKAIREFLGSPITLTHRMRIISTSTLTPPNPDSMIELLCGADSGCRWTMDHGLLNRSDSRGESERFGSANSPPNQTGSATMVRPIHPRSQRTSIKTRNSVCKLIIYTLPVSSS
ncbi:hypothetical protein Droror1_Dr00010396 [Drosera rotundifolia]